MLIVQIMEARPGMVLAADVLHPSQPDQVLLKREFVLEEGILDRLRNMGVPAIYVDYPDLSELDRHLIPLMSPERQRVYAQVRVTIAAVQKTARPIVEFADYYFNMREFVLTLFRQGQHPLYLEQVAVRLGDTAVAHATAVAHLSLMLGLRLRSYLLDQRSRLPPQHAVEVVNLGIAGMLHDIGKARLPAALAARTCVDPPDDAADRDAWEAHPQLGYDRIRGGVESSAAAAVLQHHRRYDGGGFPAPRKIQGQPAAPTDGQRLHVFARILSAADLFDRLAHPPAHQPREADAGPHRAARPAVQSLHLLRTTHGAGLDPVVRDALAQVVPPFPPGGKVGLSDGTTAVVTAIHPRDPYHPVVRRLAADGWTLQDEAVSLATAAPLTIESVDGIPVAEMIPERAVAAAG